MASVRGWNPSIATHAIRDMRGTPARATRRCAPSRGAFARATTRGGHRAQPPHLHGDERQGRRNDQPEGRQRSEDRVDVVPDACQLLARGAVRDLEHMSVRTAPDRLGHVSEVVSCKPEVLEEITHRERRARPTRRASRPTRRRPRRASRTVDTDGRGHALRRERRHPTHGLIRRNT